MADVLQLPNAGVGDACNALGESGVRLISGSVELDDGLDPSQRWQLAGFPGNLAIASYLTGPNAPQYRLLVQLLLDHQQQTLTGLAHHELESLLREQVIAATGSDQLLRDAGFDLVQRMASLRDWGVVNRWQDRAVRDEDFLRNLYRYQLTPAAAQLHRAVSQLGKEGASAVAAAMAPQVLTAQLAVMRKFLGSDPAEVAQAWAIIDPTLAGMAAAAAGWQATLAGSLSGPVDEDKVRILSQTISRYVEVWGSGVDSHSETIARDARELLAGPQQRWRAVALSTLGSSASEEQIGSLVGEYQRTLSTLLQWFDGPGSQARRLRRQMRDAIAPLVRGSRTLAAVGGHVSRRAELLDLASRIERAPSEDAAWSLWCTATGMYSARHLALSTPAPAGRAAGISFWEAEPAAVSTRLRVVGPRSVTGRPARIADRTEGRARARALAAQLRRQAAETAESLLARSGRCLCQFGELADGEFEILLAMLAEVVAVPRDQAGVRHVRTSDGLWDVSAHPPVAGPGTAVLRTRSGRLLHEDYLMVLDRVAGEQP